MKRILILGSGGAGKSTLARRLGKSLDLEVIHLDAHFWRPGWTATPADEWRATVAELAARERWVMDGNFGGTLPQRLEAADAVVFLDFPRLLCLWRAVRRSWRTWGRTRADMAPGCPEKFDPAFWWWILSYPRHSRPKILQLIEECADRKRVFVARRPRDLGPLVQELKGERSTSFQD